MKKEKVQINTERRPHHDELDSQSPQKYHSGELNARGCRGQSIRSLAFGSKIDELVKMVGDRRQNSKSVRSTKTEFEQDIQYHTPLLIVQKRASNQASLTHLKRFDEAKKADELRVG
ncbi:hypothetical protein ACH5RR_013730 [Cinchona calisaya]|uniref:Uncharacterized protein n=1 Tax=Cinchona calisaya TaxID=153742 RepID=A0ABD3A1E2_9GENT